MKKKISKWQIVLMIIIISIIVIPVSIQTNRQIFIESPLKDITMFLNNLITIPIVKANNKEKKTDGDLIQKIMNEALTKEIEELKDILELNKTLTEFEPITATVVSRNKSYWFHTITINKGKSSNIKKDMAVITKDGLIGKITKVYTNSSEVKLITTEDEAYKVSVTIRVGENDFYGILNGYDKDQNLIRINDVDKNLPIEIGQVVTTSGIGGVFPAGIYVGEVEKIEKDKYDLSKVLYIKTKVNFNNIHYVSVLKEKSK